MNLAKAIEYSRKPIIMGKSEHKEKSTNKRLQAVPVSMEAKKAYVIRLCNTTDKGSAEIARLAGVSRSSVTRWAPKGRFGRVPRVAEYRACKQCGEEMCSLDSPKIQWPTKIYCNRRCASIDNNGQKCRINGIEYLTQTDAARSLGIDYQVVRSRVNSDNYPEWVKV